MVSRWSARGAVTIATWSQRRGDDEALLVNGSVTDLLHDKGDGALRCLLRHAPQRRWWLLRYGHYVPFAALMEHPSTAVELVPSVPEMVIPPRWLDLLLHRCRMS